MVDKELLSRKLSQLKEYVGELKQADDIIWEKYQSDIRAKAFVERFLHLAIEEVIDISNHLVSFHNWREPEGFRDLFLVLHEHNVIPEEHLLVFQNMASFRNMLVHRYEKIDDEMVYSFFKKRLDDFVLFLDLTKSWVEKQNVL
jgi:uncharacterized protein YutE (UPF0331/DUF86 family)